MIRFKHKETGEEIAISKVRTYINNDGYRRNVDLDGVYDLSEYNQLKDNTDYSSILCKKALNDRL